MRIIVTSILENPVSLLRRAGYSFQRNENSEMSFVRELARAGYPRFHCYTKLNGATLTMNLHLDQKKHTHGETTRHHGEYENEGALKEEGLRIQRLLGSSASIE